MIIYLKKRIFIWVFIVGACLFAILPALGAGADPQTRGNEQALLNKAKSAGSVPVIVGLDIPFQVEGRLSSALEIGRQQAVISQTQQQLLTRLSQHILSNVKQFRTIPYMAFEVDATGLKALQNDRAIISIEEDIPVPPTLDQSIPFIHADQLHASGYDGTGYAVAVLDTGVRKTHEFLDAGKVVSEACYSTTYTTYSSTTVCPNSQEWQTGPGAGVHCDVAINGCSHGTHVAGIAAGTAGPPGSGVAPGASIIAIQVFSKFENQLDGFQFCSSSPCVLSYPSDQILALERVYALRNTYDIAAVNMSLGGGKFFTPCDSDPIKTIIDNLHAAGIATVISSGNNGWDGAVGAPACISSAVTVGATLNDFDMVADYSNHASMVDLLAPGSSILSSTPVLPTSYNSWSGTSMAAPHVAGAFAVMKSRNSSWTLTDSEDILTVTGQNVSRAGITKPRIDLYSIIDLTASNPWPADGSTVSSGGTVQLLKVFAPLATGGTFYYDDDQDISHSTPATADGNYLMATIPYSSTAMAIPGTNFWYVEAQSIDDTIRYPDTGLLSFTVRKFPWQLFIPSFTSQHSVRE